MLHVFKVHAHRGLTRPLRVAGFARRAFAPGAVVAVGNLDPGFLDVRIKFACRDLKATDRYRLAEGHGVHRAFIGLAANFIVGGAHDKTARRQHHHLRAVFAVLKDRARFGSRGGVGQGGQGTGEQQAIQRF